MSNLVIYKGHIKLNKLQNQNECDTYEFMHTSLMQHAVQEILCLMGEVK